MNRQIVISFEYKGEQIKIFVTLPTTQRVEDRLQVWYPGAKLLYWDFTSKDELAAVSYQGQAASPTKQLPLF